MLKLFNRKKKDNKGFTLVELVVVIAILAILVGLLAPQYTKYLEKARKSADATNVENVITAIKVASSDEEYSLPAGTYTVALTTSGMEVSSTDAAAALTVYTKDATTNGALTKALVEYMGTDGATYAAGKATFANVKRKSSKWGENVNPTAKAVVTDTGAVSVSYEPTALAEFAGKSTK